MEDRIKALEALKRGLAAQVKQDYKPEINALEDKGKRSLSSLGVNPDYAARTSATLKLMNDLKNGKVSQTVGNFGIEAKMTPKERALKLLWKSSF